MDLSTELKENQILLITFQGISSEKRIMDLLIGIRTLTHKIGYVSVTKPHKQILDFLHKARFNKDEVIIVDTISVSKRQFQKEYHCIFVSSPGALTEIRVAFSSLIRERNREIVLFDSLSDLLDYQDLTTVSRFANNLISKARLEGKKLVFLLSIDKSEGLVRTMSMLVDKVITY
ncbi:hypothetical protein JXC34_07005 [Candidatus Woesearchaeota archaeon]|nr:hypothetical protein [Candidatus Woesearchaeota archaeon]